MKHIRAATALLALLPIACADRDLPTAADRPHADIVPLAVVLTVENTNDDGPGSLRQTIANAQNGHVITFVPDLAGAVITLSSELLVTRSLTIHGPEGGITLQGSGDHRVLRTGNLHEVVLENLILRGGHTSTAGSFAGLGGGIMNEGANLTIRNSTIEHNWAQNAGGGIFNGGNGTLLIVGSTISYNGYDAGQAAATSFGGGIANSRAELTLVNSTVSGNTAANTGGGLHNFEGGSTLLHTTVTDNGASGGGGIYSTGSEPLPASIAVRSSIVAANSSGNATAGPDIYAPLFGPPTSSAVTLSYSLIGTTAGYAITSDGGGNQIGVNAGFVLDGYGKPLLADNGGPTRTHALMDGSPALDSADPVLCDAPPVSNRDQRDVPRPQGVNCDMGSYEATGAAPPDPAVVTALSIASQGSTDRTSGDAVVRGSITCSSPGAVQLTVTLRQEQKQRGVTQHVEAANSVTIDCAGTAAWAAGMTPVNGVFTNGKAEASVAIDVAGPGPENGTVQLFWNR